MSKAKSTKTELILCIFLGWCGAHRFYTKKYGTAFLYLFTFGLVYIGWFVDILLILKKMYDEKKRQTVLVSPTGYSVKIFNEKDLSNYKKCFIAFDLETTGLSSERDRIIEISAVSFVNFKPRKVFSTLVNPGCLIPAAASNVNHIYDSDVANAPTEREAIKAFCDFISDQALRGEIALVAHNAKFDARFLNKAFSRCNITASLNTQDTLYLSKRAVLGLPDYKLGTLAAHFGISQHDAHRAEDDARVCGELFVKLLKSLS